ncbi:hypothetical protein [Pseudomonas sp. p1(2021b)]|uniref:hypothetical protein n=1 Tax=Pseudomonas sp. p1(2021b) TaxID=2874628 RepID=UPI003D28CC3E
MPISTKKHKVGQLTFQITDMTAIVGEKVLREKWEPIMKLFAGLYNDAIPALNKTGTKGVFLSGCANAYSEFLDHFVDDDGELTRLVELLSGVTLDGEELDFEDPRITSDVLMELVLLTLDQNYREVWSKKRFSWPQEKIKEPLRQVQAAQEAYSQSPVVATILGNPGYATYTELSTILNTTDLFNIYETISKNLFEQHEVNEQARLEAERARG